MPHPLDPLTFPLSGPRLIEASAGTGKTYTIAALYLRLVLGHGGAQGFGRALTPPEILVVTFTNAATGELRDRIRSRLTQAAAFFRDQTDGDPLLAGLRADFAPDTWRDRAGVLDQAAQWMDEAAIYTIHAWSHRMLRQHAFESESLFDLALEPDDRELLEEAACDYWRHFFYPLPPAHLEEVMTITGCDTPQAWLCRVRPLLAVLPAPPGDPFAMLETRHQAMESARRQWAEDMVGAVRLLWEAKKGKCLNGNQYRDGNLTGWIEKLVHWVEEGGSLPDDTVRAKLSYTGLRKGLNKNKSLPAHPAFAVFDALNQALDDNPVKIPLVCHGAREIARRYEREKQRRGQIGYDDLLTRLADRLRQPEGKRLARMIRRQFPVALIDEFQDTDPVQYATFQRVYMAAGDASLVMIGDPKQAIYRFRGADIHTYLKARQATSGRHYSLTTNYRSTRGMANAVNRMFQAACDHDEGPFLFGDEIPFEAVDAHGRDERFMVDGAPGKSMVWWRLPQTEPIRKTTDDGYLPRMAEAFASQITNLLNRAQSQPPQAGFQGSDGSIRALRPADMAVLVRDGFEARIIGQALNRRRVRTVYLSDKDSIFHTTEAQDVFYFLRACAQPEQDALLRAALATSSLALPFPSLERLDKDERAWEAQSERFRHYSDIWRRRGVLPMLRELLHDFAVPRKLLATTGGERALTNLLHLSELLQAASVETDGRKALIRWLAEQMQDPGGALDDQILRLESDADRVRIITIHKSKGLEYPLVFLPFVCSFRKVTAATDPVLQYHDDEGRPILRLEPNAADYAAADRERLAEDLRLLYVAVTRARFACWLGIAVMGKQNKGGEAGQLHLCGLGYLLSGSQPIATEQVAERLAQLKGRCAEIAIDPLPEADDRFFVPKRESVPSRPARRFTGRVPSNWWISSYSGIVSDAGAGAAAHSAREDQLHETKMEVFAPLTPVAAGRTIHHFPRGPQPGTFLHGLFEWAADEGFGPVARDHRRVVDRLLPACRRQGWEPWVETLTEWFRRIVTTSFALPEDQGSVALAQLPDGGYQAELEFLFSAHHVDIGTLDDRVCAHILPGERRPRLQPADLNGMLKGFIDLTFCHGGRYYVLDYKSNHLGNDVGAYGLDALARCVLEHRYDLQYVLYTLAMHRLLKARLPGYEYGRHMGGSIYLFLRGIDAKGHGAYVDIPPWPLIQSLDDRFAGRECDRET